MYVRKRTTISLEAIKYQIDLKLYKPLVAHFSNMRNTTSGTQVEAFQNLAAKELSAAIEYVTRIPVVFKVVNDNPKDYTLGVLPPAFTDKHPLVSGPQTNFASDNAYMAVMKELLRDADKVLKFGVNFESGQVTGLATKLEVKLYIGTSILMDQNLTPERLAGLLIHEIGHVITYYLSLRYNTSASWAIRYAIEAMQKSEGDEEFLVTVDKLYGLLEASDVMRKEQVERRAIEESLIALILDRAQERTRSELGTSLADRSGCEALADQYVARNGAAVPYAEAIEYIMRQTGSLASPFPEYLMVETAKVCGFIVSAAMTAGFATVIWALYGSMVAGQRVNSPYDNPSDRLTRLRNDLVNTLKTTDNAELRGRLVHDVKAIDDLIPKVAQRDTVILKLAGMFSPSLKKMNREKSMIADLEKLFSNPLYIRQAQLAELSIK